METRTLIYLLAVLMVWAYLTGCGASSDGGTTDTELRAAQKEISDLQEELEAAQKELAELRGGEDEKLFEGIFSAGNGDSRDPDGIVTFADPGFERVVRICLGNMSGDITYGDLAEIKRCTISWQHIGLEYNPFRYGQSNYFSGYWIESEEAENIKSLEDLEYFTGLEYLQVQSYPLNNIRFVSHMPSLVEIELDINTFNFYPLENCKQLRKMRLMEDYYGEVNDLELGFVVNMPSLEVIEVRSELIEIIQKKCPTVEVREHTHDVPPPASSIAP